MQEFDFGYIGTFTVHAESEDQALRTLIDRLGQFPNGELRMGRKIEIEKTYDIINEIDLSKLRTSTRNSSEYELEKLAKETSGEMINISPGYSKSINLFDLAKYKQADESNLFNRLSEIDMEFTDFHISGYTSSLLEKERDEIWSELKARGYKKGDIQC